MTSSHFPSPSPNYPTIWRPLPTKPIGLGGQTNLSNSFLATPILIKSPLPYEMNFRSSYYEKSNMSQKEGSLFSKIDYNNSLNLQFDQLMKFQSLNQPQNIPITQNYFNSEIVNGGTDQPQQFGSFLFGANIAPEPTPKEKAEDKPALSELDAPKEAMSSFHPMKYFRSASSKKAAGTKRELKKGNKQLNHIMSVTNNFYFQFKNQQDKKSKVNTAETFIKKKRLREKSWNTKAKKLKKKDKTVETYLLNQISIDNVSIAKFPMIQLPEEDLSVKILTRMLASENYFEIVDKYYSNVAGLEEEMITNKSFIKLFNKEKEKINDALYLIEENINETYPEVLLKNFYKQIKETILTIQKNYIGKRKNSLNEFECAKLKKLIQSCNEITDIMTDFKKSGSRNKRHTKIKKKQQHYKTYLCEFCNKAYSNGQGLGGHISRIHHNQSEKYREKIRIRNNRVDRRQLIYDIKKELFKRYGFDLDQYNNKTDKKFIHSFMRDHREEYYKIKKEVQREHKKNNVNRRQQGNQLENGKGNGEQLQEGNAIINNNMSSFSPSDDSSINEDAIRTLETTKVETTYQQ